MTNQPEVVCQRVDSFTDMYPEFAPAPIIVRCERPAVVLWTDQPGGDSMVVCTEHAGEMLAYCAQHQEGFAVRLLGQRDREQFIAGEAYARQQHLDEDTALRACHEGTLAAGLHTPEHSPEMFDVGWEWELSRRVSAIVFAAEERMELQEQALYEQEQWACRDGVHVRDDEGMCGCDATVPMLSEGHPADDPRHITSDRF